MKVSISGIREISPDDYPVIEGVMADIISERPEEIIFGGARGADTVALAAACAILNGVRPPRLTVIVPKRLRDQPSEAQEWTRECADEIIELQASQLNTDAYRRRNQAIIHRGDGLVAFWDGRTGGTSMTIEIARQAGKPVEIIGIVGSHFELGDAGGKKHKPSSAYTHPWPHWVYAPTRSVDMTVTTLGFYMAAIEGLDRLTQFVRATKAGTVSPVETKYWARVAADVISGRPELSGTTAIVPVPRRAPGQANDMADFVSRVASETGKIDGAGLLIRTEEPSGGVFKGGRDRFDPIEHARTMSVDLEHPSYHKISPHSKVILLDNVLTFGGSLEGSRQAIIRDLPGIGVVGLSILASGDYAVS